MLAELLCTIVWLQVLVWMVFVVVCAVGVKVIMQEAYDYFEGDDESEEE